MKCTHLIQGVEGGHPRKCHDDNSSRPSQVHHGTGKTYRWTQSCKLSQASRYKTRDPSSNEVNSRAEILRGVPSTPAPTIAVMLWNAAWTCNTLQVVSAQQALQMCPAGYCGIYNRKLTAGVMHTKLSALYVLNMLACHCASWQTCQNLLHRTTSYVRVMHLQEAGFTLRRTNVRRISPT